MTELKNKLKELQNLNLKMCSASLAIINEYKRDRKSHYNVMYVKINEPLEKKLCEIVKNQISSAKTVEEYTYDCPDPENDQVRGINYSATDFFKIMEKLKPLRPEVDVISDVDELVKAKAYLIILRDRNGIQIVGFKNLPENWKLKKQKGLIPLLFKDNRFENIEGETVFSISSAVDFFYYDEYLFILSKKEFERGLNFREGMLSKAEEFYDELEEDNLLKNVEILKDKVGDNMRYLRKVATIKNLGYYKNETFIKRCKEVSEQKKWNVQFENGRIVLTSESLDDVLTILQNKRLYSELSYEDFDVESVKKVASLTGIQN